ncbi:MAG TPA: NlpC/P60 family protein [Desulfosporosinus sp.]|nr:NlpC/P60 family protein [Desulfosporosinus sp.]
MLIPSSARMWLGSATLAGLLLASSFTASASTPTAPIRTSLKPTLVASTVIPTATYTKAVRKQFKWTASPVVTNKVTTTSPDQSAPSSTKSNPVAVASVQPTTTQPTKVAPASKTNTKPVQVATASQKQVSRSGSSELVEHALSLVGAPYVFGGTSRKGFDCSGYTQYVFKGSSVSLPRTAAEQFKVGSSVSRKQLQSGDLVFFHTYTSGASHVGIYIGGGRFAHASNSGVSVSSLDESYYAGRYLGARRAQ